MKNDMANLIKAAPNVGTITLWSITFAALYVVAKSNYLLFHSISEGFSIVVGVLIYVLATKTFKYSGNNYLLSLGVAYMFIAVITFFHLSSYYGMGILPANSPNTSTQLWTAARFMEAFSLLTAPIFAKRWFDLRRLFALYLLLTAGIIAAVFWFKIFPVCFIPGYGLTGFKTISEYIACLMVFIAAIQLFRERKTQPSLYLIMITSMFFTILAELCFALYENIYGIMNFWGHILKFIALYTICEGVVLRGLEDPYDMIFKQLKANSVLDSLTGLFNRQGFIEESEKIIRRLKETEQCATFALIDLDNFKKVNDRYGHLAGDNVLRDFAGLLRRSVGSSGTAYRVGGDEFVAIIERDDNAAAKICGDIRDKVQLWTASDPKIRDLSVSIGCSIWCPGHSENVDLIVKEADNKMYQEKTGKKKAR